MLLYLIKILIYPFMEEGDTSSSTDERKRALKAFLVHLGIFVVVNLVLLFIPVFYEGELVFDFEERGPMLYGSIGWGVGVIIHGIIVFADRLINKPAK
jgi:hypothetical protein